MIRNMLRLQRVALEIGSIRLAWSPIQGLPFHTARTSAPHTPCHGVCQRGCSIWSSNAAATWPTQSSCRHSATCGGNILDQVWDTILCNMPSGAGPTRDVACGGGCIATACPYSQPMLSRGSYSTYSVQQAVCLFCRKAPVGFVLDHNAPNHAAASSTLA